MSTYPTRDAQRQAGDDAPQSAAASERTAAKRAAASWEGPVARIVAIEDGSPAWEAGFEAGCYLTAVDGRPVRDIIDWRWLSADDAMEVGYIDLDGESGTVALIREPGQDWGFSFDGVIFDAIKLCRNACTFCFMRQLPDDVRPSLVLRDDDFRLSFLSGTFVTLTNLTSEDESRIIEQQLTPLRVSLHAADAEVRRGLIGAHAAHGLQALERLLAAGIEAHCQIVLLPGVNDGKVLEDTLAWAYAHPGIVTVGIVPLGFTKHQSAFSQSFDDPRKAAAVIDAITPYQERARAERDTPWVFAADEFYVNAYGAAVPDRIPPASDYGDFDMFEDGIGIVRSFVDDFEAARESGAMEALAAAADRPVRYIIGEAMQPFFDALWEDTPLAGTLVPLTVANEWFGGNVNVTGLLTGRDVAAAIAAAERARTAFASAEAPSMPSPSDVPLYVLPRVMFNDDAVTLDDMTVPEIERAAGVPVSVVSCNPTEYLREITDMF